MSEPNIKAVRQHLLDTLTDLRSKENPMDIARARAVAEVATVLVETAKVEVDFLRATKSVESEFLNVPAEAPAITHQTFAAGEANGILSITRHVLQG